MTRRHWGIRLGAGLLMAFALSATVSAQRPAVVAAASDLQFALSEVADQFTKETGERVELVFGSSGNTRPPDQDGAPFGLFLSADERFVEQAGERGPDPGRRRTLRQRPHRPVRAAGLAARSE